MLVIFHQTSHLEGSCVRIQLELPKQDEPCKTNEFMHEKEEQYEKSDFGTWGMS